MSTQLPEFATRDMTILFQCDGRLHDAADSPKIDAGFKRYAPLQAAGTCHERSGTQVQVQPRRKTALRGPAAVVLTWAHWASTKS